jgi:hypothetical protein
MDAIRWPVLDFSQVTPKDFVRFWEQLYSGYDEDFYREKIGQPLTEKKQIVEWFEWKNGGKLSEAKTQSIHRNFTPQEHIAHDTDAGTLAAFLNKPGGAIWRIFWLHLQHPRHFPIYDQHVHRAMAFMLNWPNRTSTIPAHNPTKVRNYLEVYRPFFNRFDDCDRRKVDRALWSFGRFLKSAYGRIISSPANDEPPQPSVSAIGNESS